MIGKKHDQNKPQWHLLPYDALSYIVKVMTFGAFKYGPDNWQKLQRPSDRYFSALMRHLAAWRSGEHFDSETELPHLAHVATNAIFLLWFELQSVKPSQKDPHKRRNNRVD
jgi:hypothetical protein